MRQLFCGSQSRLRYEQIEMQNLHPRLNMYQVPIFDLFERTNRLLVGIKNHGNILSRYRPLQKLFQMKKRSLKVRSFQSGFPCPQKLKVAMPEKDAYIPGSVVKLQDLFRWGLPWSGRYLFLLREAY